MYYRPTKAMKLNYLVTATTTYIFQTNHAELLGFIFLMHMLKSNCNYIYIYMPVSLTIISTFVVVGKF
jgi:hypothetical protein